MCVCVCMYHIFFDSIVGFLFGFDDDDVDDRWTMEHHHLHRYRHHWYFFLFLVLFSVSSLGSQKNWNEMTGFNDGTLNHIIESIDRFFFGYFRVLYSFPLFIGPFYYYSDKTSIQCAYRAIYFSRIFYIYCPFFLIFFHWFSWFIAKIPVFFWSDMLYLVVLTRLDWLTYRMIIWLPQWLWFEHAWILGFFFLSMSKLYMIFLLLFFCYYSHPIHINRFSFISGDDQIK